MNVFELTMLYYFISIFICTASTIITYGLDEIDATILAMFFFSPLIWPYVVCEDTRLRRDRRILKLKNDYEECLKLIEYKPKPEKYWELKELEWELTDENI